MCGGSQAANDPTIRERGLSPRVRGKLCIAAGGRFGSRSIPACAGEAYQRTMHIGARPVYPRVCGGSAARLLGRRTGQGLSPRVRGKPVLATGGNLLPRSIPACAGEAPSAANGARCNRVYPRVCGGSMVAVPGSPPFSGSIPACAGEARRAGLVPGAGPVYPRVCGGSCHLRAYRSTDTGLSPRVRGKRKAPNCGRPLKGSIPACAGEAPPCRAKADGWPVYPRVCGGSPSMANAGRWNGGLSPRVRGKPVSGLRQRRR